MYIHDAYKHINFVHYIWLQENKSKTWKILNFLELKLNLFLITKYFVPGCIAFVAQ